jgi:hypothetical protein
MLGAMEMNDLCILVRRVRQLTTVIVKAVHSLVNHSCDYVSDPNEND